MTWKASEIHGLQIGGLDDGDCESAGRGQVAQGEIQLAQVRLFLQVGEGGKHSVKGIQLTWAAWKEN